MLTQGSNLQHKAFSSFGHLSDLLEAELRMPPSLVANRGERAKRVTFIARETSGNEAETDGDGTRQGLMRLLAPAKQTEKKLQQSTWELLYSHTGTKRNKNIIWWQGKSQLSYRRIDTPNIIQDKKQLPSTKRLKSKEKFIITKLSKIQRLWMAIL